MTLPITRYACNSTRHIRLAWDLSTDVASHVNQAEGLPRLQKGCARLDQYGYHLQPTRLDQPPSLWIESEYQVRDRHGPGRQLAPEVPLHRLLPYSALRS